MFEHGGLGEPVPGRVDRLDAAAVRRFRELLTASVTGPDGLAGPAGMTGLAGLAGLAGLSDAERVDLIRALEEVKGAAAGVQAVVTVGLEESQRAGQAAAGVPASRRGRGVAVQVGLARRCSPSLGERYLGLAKALARELPCTRAALVAGRVSEWRAMVIARETACLDPADRAVVDQALAGSSDRVAALEGLGDARLVGEVRRRVAGLDVEAVVARRRRAEAERRVSGRPAPDTMMYLTALLPVRDGVGVLAALHAAAGTALAAGDSRTRGQLMADTLVGRVTGREPATGSTPVTINLVISDRALFTHDNNHDDGHGHDQGGGGEGRGGDGQAAADRPDGSAEGDRADADRADGDRPDGSAEGDGAGGDGEDRGGAEETAYLHGYGPVPAELAREIIHQAAGPPGRAPVWLRRLYAHPGTGNLVAMESRARLFPEALKRFVTLRDQTCRTPWCNAPIRHLDHITAHAAGGQTTSENGQGLCTACNHAKQAVGWTAEPVPDPTGRHTVTITTPTGHTYRSTAPPPSG